jgi:STE24 endopeptidase
MHTSRVATDPVRSYHRWQLALGLLGLVMSVAYLLALLASGAAGALRDTLATISPRWWLQLPLMLIVFGGAYRVMTLPLSWLAGFWLPRRFGLSHQTLGGWAADTLKAGLVGSIFAIIAAEIVYAFLRATAWWWLWSTLGLLALSTLVTLVAPVWLLPIFYRLSPLADLELRDRLMALARRAGTPVLGVWVADQSRKSRTANAAVTGLGRTRRIILFDTLLRDFTPDEVEAVLAHELAHDRHGDLWRGLAVQAVLTGAILWCADLGLRAGVARLQLASPGDLAALPLLGLIFLVATLIGLPLVNWWSRRRERQADDFALRIATYPQAFIDALERLASLNLAERDPHPLKEILLYSHPSIGRRIGRASSRLRLAGGGLSSSR